MIRNPGRTIAGVAGTVVTAALGLAAWHGALAETWAGVMLLTTCGVLMLSAIAAVCRGSGEQPRFIGFAMFGWGYFALARWYSYHQGPMPTVCWLTGCGDIHNDLLSLPPTVRIAHDAWALAFAVLGSIAGGPSLQAFIGPRARARRRDVGIGTPGRLVARAGIRGPAGLRPGRGGGAGRLAVGSRDLEPARRSC